MENCESLNGYRSNLEKHILKKLAEEEDFDKCYIEKPRDHFKSFIRDEVSVLLKMVNIILLQKSIMEAAHSKEQWRC